MKEKDFGSDDVGFSEVIVIGTVAGLATAVGGLVAAFLPIQNEKVMFYLFGFSGGVMLGLSLFQLMPEGYFFAESLFPVSFGFVVGVIVMAVLSLLFGTSNGEGGGELKNDSPYYRRMGLFICLALALHNFPEGIAVGVGFAGGSALGFMIAFAMLLHNIPEGIGIGAPLRKSGMGILAILLFTAAAGIVTPIGAALGWWFGSVSMSALGWAMGLAAGAMIFVSFAKLLSYHDPWNRFGVFCGILLTFIIA